MKIYEWQDGMTPEDSKNIAYFERNMLALLLAQYSNDIADGALNDRPAGWYLDTDNNWEGWHRVISLARGAITFHIPDDFDIGNLQMIEPNWNGHTTLEKWKHVMDLCGCKINEE